MLYKGNVELFPFLILPESRTEVNENGVGSLRWVFSNLQSLKG